MDGFAHVAVAMTWSREKVAWKERLEAIALTSCAFTDERRRSVSVACVYESLISFTTHDEIVCFFTG